MNELLEFLKDRYKKYEELYKDEDYTASYWELEDYSSKMEELKEVIKYIENKIT